MTCLMVNIPRPLSQTVLYRSMDPLELLNSPLAAWWDIFQQRLDVYENEKDPMEILIDGYLAPVEHRLARG